MFDYFVHLLNQTLILVLTAFCFHCRFFRTLTLNMRVRKACHNKSDFVTSGSSYLLFQPLLLSHACFEMLLQTRRRGKEALKLLTFPTHVAVSLASRCFCRLVVEEKKYASALSTVSLRRILAWAARGGCCWLMVSWSKHP